MATVRASLSPVFSRPLSTTQRSETFLSRAREIQPRPPYARQPAISYCEATSSPGRSLGVKEYALPHLGQNPSARPGCPLRERPTGEPQLGQKRFSSGICGFFMIACDASITGAGGTRVRPAPRRAERSRDEPECTRLVILEPAAVNRLEPSAVEPSRLEPRVLVDVAPAGGAAAASSGTPAAFADALVPAALPAGVDAGALGGLPQTSQ